MLRLVMAVCAIALATSGAKAETVILDRLEAFLIHSSDGKLSGDLISTQPVLWNTVIGEGGSGGRSDDVLLVAHFKTALQAKKPDLPSILVTDKDGKQILALKNFPLTFVGEEDASKAFMLRDVTCRHLKIVITAGQRKWNNEIPFACGE